MSFNSLRISKTSEIFLHRNIEMVFPLFTPIEEKKWAYGWDPEIIHTGEDVAEGMLFRTRGQFEGEVWYNWILSRYDPVMHEIVYMVSTSERLWFITVHCYVVEPDKTKATVTYTYHGLTENGNRLNKLALDKMYAEDLKDWERAINHYLETGNLLTVE